MWEYTTLTEEALFKKLNTSHKGLSSAQSASLLLSTGANTTATANIYWWHILLRQMRSPFVYILFGASALALLLGEVIDGAMIILFITINTLIGFFQEYRSEQTLKLLKRYTENHITVYRDGAEKVISTKDLVPGDLIVLLPGDIVPSDARIISGDDVLVDESVLTGESQEVIKTTEVLNTKARNVYEAKNLVFSGTHIISGQVQAIVIATGKNTQFGSIAKLTTQVSHVSTFEKGIQSFSKFTLYVVLATLTLVVAVNLFIKGTSDTGTLLLFAVALAVSVIPEALPVVTTFSLSIGARKLANKHVIVKRLSAIEDLGSIEILCSDKTGTLTQNKMSVEEVYGKTPEKTLFFAHLAGASSKTERNAGNSAFDTAIASTLGDVKHERSANYSLIHKIPFDPKRKRVSSVFKNNGKYTMIVRGSPEEVISLCKGINRKDKHELSAWIKEQGVEGKRVLAVGHKTLKSEKTLSEDGLQLVGLISFLDPIKPSTKSALEKAKKLGVQVKIITGDSKEVAGNVAVQIGLIDSPEKVLQGEELDEMSVDEQHKAVHDYHVFARITPEQKYKIISLIEESHEVGFLGEGINDAPALKISNVAIVVQSAADIARESADIILLKQSLDVIVDGIIEGRSTFANTNKYITATMSANFGNFFAVALVSLVIPFLPMLPLQLLLVNLLSDFPSIAVATDHVDTSQVTMPTKYNLKAFALTALILGGVSTLFDFIFFSTFVGLGEHTLQTAWFVGSILTEIVFLYSIRTKRFFLKGSRPSLPLLVLSTTAALATVIIPFTSLGTRVFEFVHITPIQIGTVLLIVVLYFASTEGVKLVYYRVFK